MQMLEQGITFFLTLWWMESQGFVWHASGSGSGQDTEPHALELRFLTLSLLGDIEEVPILMLNKYFLLNNSDIA